MKSPLRYPGGKQRAIKQITSRFPLSFSEYREPFLGGGSVLLYVLENYPEVTCWANDLNEQLYWFWTRLAWQPDALVSQVRQLIENQVDGYELYKCLTKPDAIPKPPLYKAARFFVLNRITFSGTLESGGYSQKAFEGRLTPSSIQRLVDLRHKLPAVIDGVSGGVRFSCADYSLLLADASDDCFIFLDPPYEKAKKSRLYGNKGDLHTGFDHKRLAGLLKDLNCKWLMTIDDCDEVRSLYRWANVEEWDLTYGMTNAGGNKVKKGKELFVSNYETRTDTEGETSGRQVPRGVCTVH